MNTTKEDDDIMYDEVNLVLSDNSDESGVDNDEIESADEDAEEEPSPLSVKIESDDMGMRLMPDEYKGYVISRLGIFEIVGLIMHRYNMLCKGALPLLVIKSMAYFKEYNELECVFLEIFNYTFPIIIRKGQYFRSIYDYPSDQVKYFLAEIITMFYHQSKLKKRDELMEKLFIYYAETIKATDTNK